MRFVVLKCCEAHSHTNSIWFLKHPKTSILLLKNQKLIQHYKTRFKILLHDSIMTRGCSLVYEYIVQYSIHLPGVKPECLNCYIFISVFCQEKALYLLRISYVDYPARSYLHNTFCGGKFF